jgi:hypothetical protein
MLAIAPLIAVSCLENERFAAAPFDIQFSSMYIIQWIPRVLQVFFCFSLI